MTNPMMITGKWPSETLTLTLFKKMEFTNYKNCVWPTFLMASTHNNSWSAD